ncbi:MAG: MGMT family protein [Deltaproteobacteria bacterium]|nr:MGMT family protein [Deltaproteobacteria bacterium]
MFFYRHTTVAGFPVFYQLLHGDRTIHLTFDEKKHEDAMIRLQKTAGAFSGRPEQRLSAAEFAQLLAEPHPFDQFRQSIFISWGTPFQQQVWDLLCRIPRGATETYGALAAKLGNRSLARAIGQACHANPIALFIPCHRVVGASGLGGYSGGVEIKRELLQLENEVGGQR